MAAGFAWSIADLGRRMGRTPTEEDFEPLVWDFAERGRRLNAAEYLLALQDLQRHTRDVAEFFNRYDVWLTPTLGRPPVPTGELRYTRRGPVCVAPAERGVRAVYLREQWHRPAGDVRAAVLERCRPTHRHALRRAIWR